ncbi:murein biosynthesis integral membrane protein MurJ [Deferribacterales bacterium RsTz2092]
MQSAYILSLVRSGLGVLTSRVFGLIRDVVIAGVYGATGLTDIFFVAFAIPNLFRQFFAEGAISSAFVPFLSDKLHNDGRKSACTYLTQLLLVQTLLMLAICFISMLFAPYIIRLFMPGATYNMYVVQTGANILRIVMPYLFFVGIGGLLAGYLNLNNSYYVAYSSTACLNIMMIVGATVGYYQNGNIYSLAFSVFFGGTFQLALVYVYSYHKGFRFGKLSPVDIDVKRTYKLLVPSIAGVSISQLNFMIGRIVASYLEAGSISWLFYANRLFQFPLGIFSVTISTVSLTELSKARSSGDAQQVKKLIDKAIIALLLIILPATIGLVVLSQEIIQLIFARRAFTQYDVLKSAQALQMYSVGLLFYSLVAIFTRVFHSEKNIKYPVVVAGVSFVVNLIFNLILMRPLGHAGVALASSIAAVANAWLLYIGIRSYKFNIRQHLGFLLRLLLAVYAMVVALVAGKMLHLPVLLTITACMTLYFGVLHLSGVNIRKMIR